MVSKMELNNAPVNKHRWLSEQDKCSCGCSLKVWVNHKWICLDKLRAELNKVGYSLERNYDVEGVSK